MTLKADWTLLYKGVDLSSEIRSMVTSVRYTDKLHGEADEIAVELEDHDGRWRGAWAPEEGDVMQLWYGWAGGPRVYAGRFEVDLPSCHIGRGGDTLSIGGQAAPVTKSLRTERTGEFEDRGPREIAGEIAGRNGLSVSGSFNETRWRRKTQRGTRDLEYLALMAEDTDHYMSVRGDEVVFAKVDDIDRQAPVLVLSVGSRDFVTFDGELESAGSYSSARTTHFHDEEKRLVEGEERDGRVKTGDTLRIVERAEDEAQAKLMARSRLHHANRHRKSGKLKLVGSPGVVAGTVVELLPDFGVWAGRYTVDQSDHELVRGPYPTTATLKQARE